MTTELIGPVIATGKHGQPVRLTEADFKRFWTKVAVRHFTACWTWEAGRTDCGYGQFWLAPLGRSMGAHRIAASIVHGAPPAGAFVLHECDNPPCCNPAHLKYGTPAQNSRDSWSRGRNARGERQGLAKLTAEAVETIRVAYAEGTTAKALAERYGVSVSTTHRAATGRTWRHVA